jgi:hypothetical protein
MSTKKFCTQCGVEAAKTDRFCGSCGGALSAEDPTGTLGRAQATADPTTPQPPLPVDAQVAIPGGSSGWWSAPRHRLGAAVLAAAAVLAVVLGAVLAAGGGGSTTRQASVAASNTTAGSTTTTLSPAQVKAVADYRDYVSRLENILQQSAAGRGQVGSLVSGVQNGCQVSPQEASAQIRTVIDNRTSVLNQLAGLSAAPNAEAQNLYSLLQQSLQSSINADTQYKAWMDYLYTDYYYTYPVGCPNGNPPMNDSFNTARADDGNSTSLKTQFVTAFNPVATRFSTTTWDAGGF